MQIEQPLEPLKAIHRKSFLNTSSITTHIPTSISGQIHGFPQSPKPHNDDSSATMFPRPAKQTRPATSSANQVHIPDAPKTWPKTHPRRQTDDAAQKHSETPQTPKTSQSKAITQKHSLKTSPNSSQPKQLRRTSPASSQRHQITRNIRERHSQRKWHFKVDSSLSELLALSLGRSFHEKSGV